VEEKVVADDVKEPDAKEEPLVEAGAAEEESPAEELPDEKAVLQRQLEEERAKAAEYLDGWQRARAELANARKRWTRESSQTYFNAVADVIGRLLPAMDDFERAIETRPEESVDRGWVDGVSMIYRKLRAFLEQQGITPIEAEPGTPFDPERHQAVTHEPHETLEAGAIIAEFQKGYKLKERIVRPAMVRVSSGSPAPEAEPTEERHGDEPDGQNEQN
jgi:molecular chaperone GrpE